MVMSTRLSGLEGVIWLIVNPAFVTSRDGCRTGSAMRCLKPGAAGHEIDLERFVRIDALVGNAEALRAYISGAAA
jgi:hypothetical protein